MNKEEIWNCPVCGKPYWNWMDALDHIAKDHTLEYKAKFYHDNVGGKRLFV